MSRALKEAMKLTPHSPYQLIRILLVDDQAIVREGLRMLLENQAGMRVVSEASTCKQALEAVQREQPDVILLDLDLGASMGSDCLTSLLAASPQSRILVLTGVCDLSLHQTAIRKGAMGLVQKIEAAEVLVKAIRQVHSGEVWLGTTLMTRLLNELWQKNSQPSAEFQPAETALNSSGTSTALPQAEILIPQDEMAKIALLTEREHEVVKLIGEGLRNQQIADRLCISIITVRHHLSSIFSKLGLSDRFELAIYAYRYGLASIPSPKPS